MPTLLLYIITLYFTIGAIAIIFINRRNKSPENKERWIKYLFYLLVVYVTLFTIIQQWFQWLTVVIIVIGLAEIINAQKKSKKKNTIISVIALILYILIAVGFYFFAGIENSHQVLFVYTIVFCFDGFAQISGQLFGGRKMLPSVSPQKTMSGALGGFIAALVTAFLIKDWTSLNTVPALLLAAYIAVAALSGDVLASLYKRKTGIKDYSKIIPGHGGILDRYDSFMMAGACYFLIYIFSGFNK